MNNKNYAFPHDISVDNGDGTRTRYTSTGMTLRDYIATRALQGFLSCEVKYASTDQMLARDCYRLADEMLKAR